MFLGVGHRINERLNSQHFVNSTNTRLDVQGTSRGFFKGICFTFVTINPKTANRDIIQLTKMYVHVYYLPALA